jgi:hypothetical protein
MTPVVVAVDEQHVDRLVRQLARTAALTANPPPSTAALRGCHPSIELAPRPR